MTIEGLRLISSAIRAVPWYRDLYLAGMELLLPHLEAVDVTAIVHLMSEKELRLRIVLPL